MDTSRPLISDIEIWQTAADLVREHGEGAEQEAISEMRVHGSRGDNWGQEVWAGVLDAVLELLEEGAPDDGLVR